MTDSALLSSLLERTPAANVRISAIPETPSRPAVVLVLILRSSSAGEAHVQEIEKAFSDSYFQTLRVPVSDREDQLRAALVMASQDPWTSHPAIIIHDSSVTHLPPETIVKRVRSAIQHAPNAHLCYLSKWQDDCGAYKQINSDDKLNWTRSPQGVQALLLTSEAREILLKKKASEQPLDKTISDHVADGSLKATCFVPNLFSYDPMLARSASDYRKLNDCASEPDTSSSPRLGLWLLIAIIGVALLILLLLWLARK